MSSDKGIIYQLKETSISFGKIDALKAVQLTITSGEMLFITGVSGAGKTTLLRLLAGDVAQTTGSYEFRSADKTFIASIFQDLRLKAEWTVEENLWTSYDSVIYKSKHEFEKELSELARVLGITDRLDHKIQIANGGLKQKVAIARALLSRPTILLADEPTSSLDHDSSVKIYELLSFYNQKRGLTVIWASHNRELVKKFAGRILHLDQGRLIYSGHACFI